MATEYCLTYTYAGTSNSDTLQTAPIVNKSSFTLSGNTDKKIGRITRIVYKHWHTSKGSPTWILKGRLHFANGSYVDSDEVSHDFSRDVYEYINTFSDSLPSASLFDTWSKIETVKVNSNSDSETLYWRAETSYKLIVEVYFVEAGVMYYGIDDTWKECEVYYGSNDKWIQVTPYYGIDDEWKST